jgi:hypothetical protein
MPYPGTLRPRRERPHRHARQPRDEFSPSHRSSLQPLHREPIPTEGAWKRLRRWFGDQIKGPLAAAHKSAAGPTRTKLGRPAPGPLSGVLRALSLAMRACGGKGSRSRASASRMEARKGLDRFTRSFGGPAILHPISQLPGCLLLAVRAFLTTNLRPATDCGRSGPDRKGPIDPGHVMRPRELLWPHGHSVGDPTFCLPLGFVTVSGLGGAVDAELAHMYRVAP